MDIRKGKRIENICLTHHLTLKRFSFQSFMVFFILPPVKQAHTFKTDKRSSFLISRCNWEFIHLKTFFFLQRFLEHPPHARLYVRCQRYKKKWTQSLFSCIPQSTQQESLTHSFWEAVGSMLGSNVSRGFWEQKVSHSIQGSDFGMLHEEGCIKGK